MSRDDQRSGRNRRNGGDNGRWAAVEGGVGTWAQGDGLLDDLPEAGRGTGALKQPAAEPGRAAAGADSARRGTQPRPNPFQAGGPHGRQRARRAPEPAAQEPAAEAPESAATGAQPPAAAAEPAAPAEEQRPEPRAPGIDAPRAPFGTPNVIPFRSTSLDRFAAHAAPAPAAPPADPPTAAAVSATAPAPDETAAPPAAKDAAAPLDAAPPVPEEAPAPPQAPAPPAPPAAAAAPVPPAAAAPPEAAEPAAPQAPQTPAFQTPAPLTHEEPRDHAYSAAEREAVYRAIRERRDVRVGFRPDPVADPVLTRVLEAAHQAPSAGSAQPWDFVIIHDPEVRAQVHRFVQEQRDAHARALPGARARAFSGLKAEAVLDAPVNIVVTVDPTRGGGHALGRQADPRSAGHSAALAVENLWLAARAEGLGVGWVNCYAERDLARELDLPPHLEVVAYLCVGYVDDFPTEPELALGGWAQQRPLSWAVHRDHYGRRGLPGEEPTSLLDETIAAIRPQSQRAMEEVRGHQRRFNDGTASLGALEEVQVRLAGLAGEAVPPVPEPAAVAVFSGDHGVHAQGASAWPQDTTQRLVRNLLSGGAVANAFADQVGAEVTVVDVGLVGDLPDTPGLLPRKIARGTADGSAGAAMSGVQVGYAVEAGIEVARDLVAAGNRCLVTGDIGIANTIGSAALVAAFTGSDPAEVTEGEPGADRAAREHAVGLVRRSLDANGIASGTAAGDPLRALAALGGLEHAALAGFVLGAAALRVPVVLDDAGAGAAALVAAALAPDAVHACVAGFRSTQPGHSEVIEHLGLRPLMDMELRFGQGSGALLALPLLQGAVRALHEATPPASSGEAG
ncbi:cob(II)yrinic acid a,c-diamide reductase [Murinocardiopsis flavida]|uniref:Nicotinate-nucleotide--dimethylbenzimidazole phosphoribosyltransferase n=1 Tax=Murinocardiopsis flavida TaxID=645275 RepID=A0A2P8DUE1_9ACTN|nr:5,6-dimethylbenzimidazole synthase [Murinocardiopsis flavida]PSL00837.1 cob(II)yrinic acid a,c-diamide reductase [Murinocardiopsis flavida]